MTRAGPPLELKSAVEQFRKAHKKTFLANHRMMAEIRRPCTSPEQAVGAAAKDEYVRHRQIKICLLGKDSCNGSH